MVTVVYFTYRHKSSSHYALLFECIELLLLYLFRPQRSTIISPQLQLACAGVVTRKGGCYPWNAASIAVVI